MTVDPRELQNICKGCGKAQEADYYDFETEYCPDCAVEDSDINPTFKNNKHGNVISDEYDDPNNLMGV